MFYFQLKGWLYKNYWVWKLKLNCPKCKSMVNLKLFFFILILLLQFPFLFILQPRPDKLGHEQVLLAVHWYQLFTSLWPQLSLWQDTIIIKIKNTQQSLSQKDPLNFTKEKYQFNDSNFIIIAIHQYNTWTLKQDFICIYWF